ncbi:hypothetical protein ABIE52_000240 [Rhodococcus sp. OAS809]|uniref:MBL fold metallo-hydrolase n=1 Tax=Rhodococcus sp. OAS809 TaxID=2663874 RepID=UPI0019F16F84
MSKRTAVDGVKAGYQSPMEKGIFTFIGNATFLIRYGNVTILTDPNFLHRGEYAYLGHGLTSKRLHAPASTVDQLPRLDAVVLSHLHGDHWDRRAQAGLDHALPVTTEHAAKKTSWFRKSSRVGDLGVTHGHGGRRLGSRHRRAWPARAVVGNHGADLTAGDGQHPRIRFRHRAAETLRVRLRGHARGRGFGGDSTAVSAHPQWRFPSGWDEAAFRRQNTVGCDGDHGWDRGSESGELDFP